MFERLAHLVVRRRRATLVLFVLLAVETREGLDAQAPQATALVQQVRGEPGVTQVVSYWTSGRPAPLAGTDGRTGQVLVFGAPGATYDQRTDLAKRIQEGYSGARNDLVV